MGEALIAYQDLCQTLDEHIRKPHAYYLQARSGISHSIWNLYCTQFPEEPLDEFDESDRKHADDIYKSNLTETVPVEYEIETLADCESNGVEISEEDKEKAALLEATRQMVDQSSQKVAEVRAETEAIKAEGEEVRQEYLAHEAVLSDTVTAEENGHCDKVVPGTSFKTELEIEIEKATAEEQLIKQKEKEIYEKELEVKRSRRHQWEAEDKERKQRENERKRKREKETEDKIKREMEREKVL